MAISSLNKAVLCLGLDKETSFIKLKTIHVLKRILDVTLFFVLLKMLFKQITSEIYQTKPLSLSHSLVHPFTLHITVYHSISLSDPDLLLTITRSLFLSHILHSILLFVTLYHPLLLSHALSHLLIFPFRLCLQSHTFTFCHPLSKSISPSPTLFLILLTFSHPFILSIAREGTKRVRQ